jgi:DNA-binding NtrC family response regulator
MMSGLQKALADSPHCLIVDDEPALRQLLVALMTDAGFTCIEAEDGEAALAAMERHSVPLVLSDLRMPKLDGLGLLAEIRRRWPDTAVILISGVSDVKVAVSALGSGAMD